MKRHKRKVRFRRLRRLRGLMVLMNDEDIVLPGFMNDEDIVLPGFMNDEDIVLPGFVNRRRHCSSGIYEPTEAPFIRKVDVLVNPADNFPE
ncbi:MAG TPA: hypothetical protein PKI37_02495 [Candidatus Cloacimonas sp.]|nr:hypothetical protein [Candidatus Cloacimonas sp.]